VSQVPDPLHSGYFFVPEQLPLEQELTADEQETEALASWLVQVEVRIFPALAETGVEAESVWSVATRQLPEPLQEV